MELKGESKLLRIFIGEADKSGHVPLYEAIVGAAKKTGLAGATAWRGIIAYGLSSRVRTEKILDLSSDMPVVIELVDTEERISLFLPILHDLFEKSKCGGLVTMECVQVIKYTPGSKSK